MRAPYTINDRTFDLTHMNGFEGKTDANLRAGQVKKAPIKVEFSCHCWSRRPVDGEAIPPSHLVPEGSIMYDKVNYGKPYSFAKVMGEVWEGRYP